MPRTGETLAPQKYTCDTDEQNVEQNSSNLWSSGSVMSHVVDLATDWSADRFDPDRFEEESVKKSFHLLGFSGSQTCPELR